MDANERYEIDQGEGLTGLLGATISQFAEEDLPSDIIGFYVGQKRQNSYYDSLPGHSYKYDQVEKK